MFVKTPGWIDVLSLAAVSEPATVITMGRMFSPNELSMPPGPSSWFFLFAFAASVQTLAGTSAVASAVKGDPYGIGYGGIAYLEGIRALDVKKDDASPAITPSLKTAQDGTYPIARFLYFYTSGETTGLSKRFIDWVKSPDGQGVIEQVGYYPLPRG